MSSVIVSLCAYALVCPFLTRRNDYFGPNDSDQALWAMDGKDVCVSGIALVTFPGIFVSNASNC